jgi:hypothetical protein
MTHQKPTIGGRLDRSVVFLDLYPAVDLQDFVLRRDYEDPDYPRQFHCALRGLTAGAVNR